MVLIVEYIFLTIFYGLYFNHQLHITISISSSSYMFMVTFCKQLSCAAPTPVSLSYGYYQIYYTQSPFKLELFNYLFSLKNSRPCWDWNPGRPRYQANMLPTELSWLESVELVTNFLAGQKTAESNKC